MEGVAFEKSETWHSEHVTTSLLVVLSVLDQTRDVSDAWGEEESEVHLPSEKIIGIPRKSRPKVGHMRKRMFPRWWET